MKLSQVGTWFALSALACIAAAGGCEAIVSNDVPAYTCSSAPFVSPNNGSCPSGMFCDGAGCIACNAKGDDPCDGYDNDCDGVIDDGPKSDRDGDGYTYCGKVDKNGAPIDIDCNDNDKTISPGGKEICNGKDDNCDGIIDNANLVCPTGETCVPTTGACISNAVTCNTTNCPAPKVCDPQTQACILANSTDAGASCTSSEQCTSGICATTTELGDAGATAVCTQTCCTSADCAAGYVCYGTGTGGNYCIEPGSISRATPGTAAPGATCARDSDCRSGSCNGTHCEDTCCSDSSCTGGTRCTATTFAGSVTLACLPPTGTSPGNASCHSNSDCASGYCAAYLNSFGDTESFCAAPCCGSKQCGTIDSENVILCNDNFYPPPSATATPTSGPVVPVCYGVQEGKAGGQVGAVCTHDTDCFSNHCLIFNSQQLCSDVCCVDSDCASTGWVCRPTPDGPGTYLRCVPPGN